MLADVSVSYSQKLSSISYLSFTISTPQRSILEEIFDTVLKYTNTLMFL